MSRELEIRTTILAKKSGRTKAERKDANDNDVYADEALQLLQEIQELKNNMQKTDERILNTYKKSPTSKPKRKSSATESTGRRVAYDVIYPSVGSDHHRDMLVSHCLNPSSTKISPGAGSLYVPAPTTFTSAPANNSSLRQKAAPSSSSLEERIYQQRRQEAATAERRRMMTSSAGESNVNIEKLILIDNTAAGSSSSRTFKRVYAQSSCSPDSTGEIMRGDDDLSSHEAEEVRPPPSAREGENIRHARTTSPTLLPEANPTHTQLEEPESRPVAEEEQQLTGVEMEESLQATPRAADPEAERASAAAVDHQEERKDGERVRQERVKHYDREEIRKYMQKQKKDRKTTKESPSSAPPKIYERHLTRSGPTRRAELGLPSKPSVITKRKQPQILSDPSATQTLRQEENWGPYDSPNFVDAFTSGIQQQEIAKTPPPPLKRKDRTIGANQESKSIQTEAGSYRVDEATQVSSSSTRRRNDDSSDEWLHILPSARVESNSSPPPLPLTISNSSGLSSLRPQEQQPQKPKPVTNLLRQIEVLEHYIGNILEAPSLHLHQETVQPLSPRIQLQQPPPPPPPQQRNQTVKMPIRPPQHYSTPMQTAVTDGGSGRRLASHPQGSSSLDSSASTEYIPLPDQLTEFVHRSSKRSRTKVNSTNSNAAFLPSGMNHGSTDVKSLFRTTERSTATTTAATKYYDGEEPGAAAGLSSFFQLPPPKSSKPPAQPEEPQQTYFRDFNEILQMDPNNPMTERSNSWKRVSRSRATEQPKPTLPSAPYNILSAITDELRKAQEDINRMPKRSTANITSDTDFQSRLSISDASSADAAPPPQQQQQPSKNGSGSRIAPADGDSRTKNKLPTPKPIEEPRNPPELMETTYLTLTPQYTSLDTTTQSLAGVHPPNSSVLEEIDEQKQQDASSIFSARLSPIPRAVSPLSLVSNDSSLMERKQSTSSSERSEHDRSMGDPVVEESASRITKTPSPVAQATIQAVPSSGVIGRTPEDLITRLRSELLRDESLMRSLHHVERLEDAAANGKMQDQQKRFRIQFDPQTRSFFESQTEALRAIAHDVRSGLASHLQGSKQVTSSSESDKIQNEGQEQPDVESKQGTYTPDFSAEEVPSESWATTEKSTASDPKSNPASGSNGHGKAHHQHASDSDSTLTALSDTSVLPPKAVDLLLQEEAKQQRLLLKLREKAQVEKTLAELELLQMQKRILRAQGEREKAASIKKKQRGLLLKLQEERARIESLRRQHKKDEQRSKGSFGESNNNPYDSTFWETDWSASSAASAAPSGGVAGAESSISSIREKVDGDGDESSSTTLYAPSEVIQASADEKEVEEAEDEPISQPKSELEEGNESASAASNTSNNNLRLRAPLSPRTGDNIRVRMKFRHRHSSGSDDSINLSQTETASDVSDVESRLLALTDQLTRRQAEAQRLKGEHKRISKEKLKAQESALIKQIEVYDRCITDLRTQLDRDPDVEAGGSSSAVLAVRPVIRQPRALTRADDAKSPTSSIRNESGGAELLDTTRSLEGSMLEGPPSASQSPRKVDATGSSSTSSSIATDIRTEDDLSAAADQLTDGGVEKENAAEISDSARTSDPFNQTMIIKSDSQVKEELAEEISRSILNSLVDETVDLATDLAIKNRAASKAASSNVMQRVSALLSAGSDAQKGDRSQLYLTTTFDLSSPDEARSPAAPASATAGSSASTLPSDVTSTEGRSALESKLNELQIENEWIDDDLETVPIHSDVESEENRLKVLQEAEALEKEQKRIEQEIQRLSSGSVLYLQREIPNKPPPPYTPPGQALSWPQQQLQLKIRPTSAPEIHRVVPKSKDEVSRYCRRFANFVLDSALNSTDPAFPEELYAVDFPVKDQPAEYQTNRRAFMMLLGDLSRTFVLELIQRATFLPNWRAGGEGGSSRPIRTREELVDAVENSVLVQFNYRPRLRREGQLAKWSQKKRDRVDEILVKELQTEEKLWTDFSKEEAEVKRQTADAILDLLLEETVQVYKRILQASKRAS